MKYMGRLIIFVLLLGVMQTVTAGKLDEFEKDASSNKESKSEETAKQEPELKGRSPAWPSSIR
jgi:hypothetical protein